MHVSSQHLKPKKHLPRWEFFGLWWELKKSPNVRMRRDLGGLLKQLSQSTDEETKLQRSYLLEGHIVCNGGKFEGTVQLPFLYSVTPYWAFTITCQALTGQGGHK